LATGITRELPTSASRPSSSAAAVEASSGLVAYEYVEDKAFAHRVLQFLDKMKSAVDDREGEHSSFFEFNYSFVLLIHLCNCL
jgi:hypothetical protein